MTTSAEDLNAAIAALQSAADAYNGKKAEIDNKVNTLVNSASALLSRSIHIDPVNGDDANSGDANNPVKTLAGAAALTATSGQYDIVIYGDLVCDKRIVFKGQSIMFRTDALYTKRRIDFANQIDGVDTRCPHIVMGQKMGVLDFRDIIFGNNAAAPHVVYKRMIEGTGFTVVNTWICEWDTAAGDDLHFVGSNSQVALWILSGTFPAEQAGHWMEGVAAATDPATVSKLVNTNLTTL